MSMFCWILAIPGYPVAWLLSRIAGNPESQWIWIWSTTFGTLLWVVAIILALHYIG